MKIINSICGKIHSTIQLHLHQPIRSHNSSSSQLTAELTTKSEKSISRTVGTPPKLTPFSTVLCVALKQLLLSTWAVLLFTDTERRSHHAEAIWRTNRYRFTFAAPEKICFHVCLSSASQMTIVVVCTSLFIHGNRLRIIFLFTVTVLQEKSMILHMHTHITFTYYNLNVIKL